MRSWYLAVPAILLGRFSTFLALAIRARARIIALEYSASYILEYSASCLEYPASS